MKIKPISKLVLIGALGIIVCVTAFIIYSECTKATYETKLKSSYEYTSRVNFSYNPSLVESFEEINLIMDDDTFIRDITKSISINLKYSFYSSDITYLEYKYNIATNVEAYSGSEANGTYLTIWSKNIDKYAGEGHRKDTELKVNEVININLDDYNSEVDSINELTGMEPSVNLYANINLSIIATDARGEKIDITHTPRIKIPFKDSYFKITENGNEEISDSITETIQVPIPIDKKKIIILSILLVLCIAALIFIVFFTKGVETVDKFEKELRKIFKNHGNRMVALNAELSNSYEYTHQVKSIDDLVRIADELSKPILYKYSDYRKDMHEFYVLDGTELYTFDLDKQLKEENKVEATYEIDQNIADEL